MGKAEMENAVMSKRLVLVVASVLLALCTSAVFAQRRAVDDFANRRNYERWQQQVRKDQARASRRVVPTITIPQPAFGYPGYGTGYVNGAYDYVLVPAGYQVINGRLQYVPAHYVLVPRYGW
jgi:hypothetical protein